MKKFLSRVAIFGSPFLVAWIVIMMLPLDREFAYSYAEKDSGRYPWLYYRVHANETPIDWAFFGTSRTMEGVNDQGLEEGLLREYEKEEHVANLGISRMGRNLHWLLVSHLFEKKEPHTIVLEVTEEEGKHSHLGFPFLATGEQVFSSPFIGSKSYLPDIQAATEMRFLYYRDYILGNIEDSIAPPDMRPHIFHAENELSIADPALLERYWKIRHEKLPRELPTSTWGEARFSWDYAFPKAYMEKIVEQCAEREVRLIFLYIPGYGVPTSEPVDHAWYEERGELWVPPASIFSNPNNWKDSAHLNIDGAEELRKWLLIKMTEGE